MSAIFDQATDYIMMESLVSPNSDTVSRNKKALPLDLESTKSQFFPEGYTVQNPRPSVLGVPSAMIFRPTKNEFADPYKYIKSISSNAVRYGIVKIIPPEGWDLGFHLDTERFWFMTRVQNLNLMDGTSRAFLNYLDQLQRFHNQRGHSLSYIPILDRKPINLLRLKKSVDDLGGYKLVTENKQWAAVGRAIGLGGKTCTSLSHSIKRVYVRWIQPYEEYMAHNSIERRSRKIPRVDRSPESNSKAENVVDSSTLDENSSSEITPAPNKSCQRRRPPSPQSPSFPPEKNPAKKNKVARCQDVNDTTPISESNNDTPNDTSSRKSKEVRPGEEICEFCGSGANDEKMLLCDGCDRGYHLYCFDPPIIDIPSTDWYCPHCLTMTRDSYGFEEKEVRSLHKFQKIANKFKVNYFEQKRGKEMTDNFPKITEEDCEREFWETVQNSYGDLTVEYGADIHSSKYGSGFPTIEKQPYNEYSRCGWNLNVLPLIKGSVLNYTKKKGISGIMTPWLYVGMLFSTFCWHAEDQHLYSMSYSHWGETKTWYGVPSESAADMERVMRDEFPDLFKTSPDLLFHLTTLISPKVLIDNGVSCYMIDQRPGEFIVTFPGAYHCGFSHGFNFTEAVNFANFDWLPRGYKCLDLLSSYKKTPLFPFEEIVFGASEALISKELELDDDEFAYLLDPLTKVCNKELHLRKVIRESGVALEKVSVHADDDPVYVECSICSKFCYLSCLLVPLDTSTHSQSMDNGTTDTQQQQKYTYYCLDQYQDIAPTLLSNQVVLNLYFTDSYISSLLNSIKNYRTPYPQQQPMIA